MRSGESSDLTVAASDRLFHSFGSLGNTHSNDAALSGSLDRIREMDEARASRLIKSDQQLPAMFWVFMIGGGLLLIGYSTILSGRESFFGQILFIMPVVAIYKVEALARFRHGWVNGFILLTGSLSVSALLFSLLK